MCLKPVEGLPVLSGVESMLDIPSPRGAEQVDTSVGPRNRRKAVDAVPAGCQNNLHDYDLLVPSSHNGKSLILLLQGWKKLHS